MKLAALRLESEEKDLGAMAWVLKMDDATIESGLVHDFDASLSGIGQELGAGAYSMRLEQHALQSTAFQESIINLGRCSPDGELTQLASCLALSVYVANLWICFE